MGITVPNQALLAVVGREEHLHAVIRLVEERVHAGIAGFTEVLAPDLTLVLSEGTPLRRSVAYLFVLDRTCLFLVEDVDLSLRLCVAAHGVIGVVLGLAFSLPLGLGGSAHIPHAPDTRSGLDAADESDVKAELRKHE